MIVINILLFEIPGDRTGYVNNVYLNTKSCFERLSQIENYVYFYRNLQGDQGYFYVPYKYLIDKRLVVTADAFWAIAEIVPRRMKRRGYISYPNFTQYHQQYMLPLTDKNYQEQQQKYRYRRRRHYYQ
jgi:hypothetical protein